MAKYILANKVIFDNERNSLTDVKNENDYIILPMAVSRCLKAFIECKGTAVSKKDIMYIGWGKYGTVVAEGSLWQAISQLRKAFVHFGLNEKVIITVPRLGYQLSSTISVELYPPSILLPENEKALNFVTNDYEHVNPDEKLKGKSTPSLVITLLGLKKIITKISFKDRVIGLLITIMVVFFIKN